MNYGKCYKELDKCFESLLVGLRGLGRFLRKGYLN